MEPTNLSSRLSQSSSYRREKTFRYPISKDSSNSPFTRQQSIRDESTNPTPLNGKSSILQQCPTDPNLRLIALPLNSSPSVQSIPADTVNRNCINTDVSPCKTEVPMRGYPLFGFTYSNLSMNSPSSFGASPQKGSSFSRAIEKYENGTVLDTFEIPLNSARSGLYHKEDSCEISAIAEENSASEHPFPSQPSILYTGKVHEGSIQEPDSLILEKNSSASLNSSFKHQSPQEKPSISLRAKTQSQNLQSLSFEEAYTLFKNLNLEYFSHNLWHSNWKDLFCCRKFAILSEENLELCEKLIIFTYLGFSQEDFFHNRLLVSVCDGLSFFNQNKVDWTDLGFSSSNPYKSDLTHDAAALGLLQLLFVEKYMPELLEENLKYCLSNNMAFVMIAFDMSEISITILRKRLLNQLIVQSSKSLEIIFFLYAGCLTYWFTLHKSQDALPGEINYLVESLALKNPVVLINLAKEKYESALEM